MAGLALGGDDYITKPFSLDEVLERIRAVLRRTGYAAATSRLRVAGLELDEDGHEVRRDGTVIAVTPTEFRLLRYLMLNAGRVCQAADTRSCLGPQPGRRRQCGRALRQLPAAQGRPGGAAPDSHHPRGRLCPENPAAVRTWPAGCGESRRARRCGPG